MFATGAWPLLGNLEDPELRRLAQSLPATVLRSRANSTTKKYRGAKKTWAEARQGVPSFPIHLVLYMQPMTSFPFFNNTFSVYLLMLIKHIINIMEVHVHAAVSTRVRAHTHTHMHAHTHTHAHTHIHTHIHTHTHTHTLIHNTSNHTFHQQPA